MADARPVTAPSETTPLEWWRVFPRYARRRGHLLVLHADRRWRWAATGRFVPGGRRPLHLDPPCVACGLPPTPEGYDACLGHIPGARAACCGHGVKEPYVSWGDGDIERGEAALAAVRSEWRSAGAGPGEAR